MNESVSFASLPEAFFATAQKFPQNLALVDPPSVGTPPLTYSEARRFVMSAAQCLIDLDVHKGDRVGLISIGRSWWPICDLAIMSAGAWTVPIYPSLPANQVGFIVRHAGLQGMFVEDERQFEKLVRAHEEERLPLRFVVVLNDEAFHKVCGTASPWPVFRYQTWIHSVSGEEAVQAVINAITLDDPATIVYTSGTTGTPKGVMLTHRNILANLDGIRTRLEIRSDDIHLSYLPLSHILERTCGQFIVLLSGGSVNYAESIDTIVRDFSRVRPTTFTTVPRLLEKVQERVEAQMRQAGGMKQRLFEKAISTGVRSRVEGQSVSAMGLALYDKLVFDKIKRVMGGRLRMIVSGGAPLAPHVGRFFMALGMPIVEGYGMTESSPVISVNLPSHPRLGTVGQRLPNVDVRIAEDGELLVRGASISPGYYLNDEANKQAFTEDGWLKTGDMAEISEDGFIRITDRKKHLLVLSTGKKVTPAPIENDIIQSPFIDQACLVGNGRKFVSVIIVPNDEAVAAWQSQQAESGEDSAQIYNLLQAEVARTTASYAKFEHPKAVIIAEPFTIENDMLTPTLKVKANKVVEVYQERIDVVYGTPSQNDTRAVHQ
ncbi:AMP-dependent synthetase/ligase [Alicyclobacillus dauci]|uniref:Long-chain fatty acid--CoA ligase n=1 Tax=Alicyclobacillus dauci TaxID=1475485 RepID=A0ABY6Z006_9BACL|nr:long-chain fatty acid--CoA ligase [Alicyclobacillus dauci]WAH35853.1 long-chain fatty acid--CoA ligase [Alicyclobacillus dauci]